ncbi:CDP-glycerol glycerophosphotransferase family protein [Alkalihalobacillus sp. 1P02AB]|uniref:CDP-glycerol glycerophosphotransferase family protein n=1 Tax=Alkalihalobacillus sp. 1P02AB TaxID=3132260 RepID=UPI0039A65934
MGQKIKVLSVDSEQIKVKKLADVVVNSIQLIDDLNNEIKLSFKDKIEEVIIINPIKQLEENRFYSLYMNDVKLSSTSHYLFSNEQLRIESSHEQIVFLNKSKVSPSVNPLVGQIGITNAKIEGEQLLLEVAQGHVSISTDMEIYAVNEENAEIKRLSFHCVNNVINIELLNAVKNGKWHLKVRHTFQNYLLIDSFIQGNPTKLNQTYLLGNINHNTDSYIGVFFEGNNLCLFNSPKKEFLESVPFNEKREILIGNLFKDQEHEDTLWFNLLDNQLTVSELTEIVLISRKNKERIAISFQIRGTRIGIEMDQDWVKELKRGRWDIWAEFLTNDNSIRAKLKLCRESSEKQIHMFKQIDEDSMIVYTTMNNFMSLFKSTGFTVFKEKNQVKTKMVNLRKNGNNGFTIAIEVTTKSALTIENITIKLRSQDVSKLIILDKPNIQMQNEETCIVSASYDVDWDKDFFPLYWDVFVTCIDEDNNTDLIKVTSATNKLKRKINKNYISYAVFTDHKIMYPYITLKNEIAFMMRDKEVYENKLTKLKEKVAYLTYIALKPIYFRNKDIWIGFEKFSSTAQDNGYAFFQYVDKNKLHDHFYYILDKSSSDYEEARRESNRVVPFMSFKYLVLLFASNLLVSSENKRHVYNLRVRSGLVPKKIANKRSVFLQHGVTALKKSNVFKKAKRRGNFSLVIATSEIEKEIIHQNWKYELNEIAVTGFSRWDKLFDKSLSQERRKIFVMPTWRTWIEGMPKEEFIKTDYYLNYINFLNSEELKEILIRYKLELVFFLHPKFKEYIVEFKLGNEHVQLKEFQNIKVNEEIMEASMMISDYSSVTWDMFYLKKPVAFFQFDYEKYNEYEGSYIKMEEELFGDRALDIDTLIRLINEYADNDFQMKPAYEQLHNEYFQYVDHNNSKRIFDVIKRLK